MICWGNRFIFTKEVIVNKQLCCYEHQKAAIEAIFKWHKENKKIIHLIKSEDKNRIYTLGINSNRMLKSIMNNMV